MKSGWFGLSDENFEERLREAGEPSQIWITTLFPYDRDEIARTIASAKSVHPRARVVVGGAFASILPEVTSQMGADVVHRGLLDLYSVNFFAPSRANQAEELFERIAKRDVRALLWTGLEPRRLTPKRARIMREAGCIDLLVPLQTVEPELTAKWGRKENLARYGDAVSMLVDAGFDLPQHTIDAPLPALRSGYNTFLSHPWETALHLTLYNHVPQAAAFAPLCERVRVCAPKYLEIPRRLLMRGFEEEARTFARNAAWSLPRDLRTRFQDLLAKEGRVHAVFEKVGTDISKVLEGDGLCAFASRWRTLTRAAASHISPV